MHSGIQRDSISTDVRPQDDLYQHANGAWLDSASIPSDKARYGAFEILRDAAEENVRAICEEAAEVGAKGDAATARVGGAFAAFMDAQRAEAAGAQPLRPMLDAVEALHSTDDLHALLARLRHDGIDGVLAPFVSNDMGAPGTCIVYLTQAGLTLPDEAYYRAEQHAEVLAAFREHAPRLLAIAGIENAEQVAAAAIAVEEKLATGHVDVVKRRDAVASYNKVTVEELAQMCPAFDWSSWLEALGVPAGTTHVVVREPDYVRHLATVLNDTDVADWRAWATWHIVSMYAPMLHAAAVDEDFAFTGATLSGREEQQPRWKRAVAFAESVLRDDVGRLYVERHFPPEAKERMEQLVANVTEAFCQDFQALSWMGDETREKALEKLSTFRPKIGYPTRWIDYSAVEVNREDLVGTARSGAAADLARDMAKVGQPVDLEEWLMGPQTVNAYYHPVMNEIVFPAAILQPPFFDVDADDAANYGGIGAVIAHEIGHGFDDQGSQYDSTGQLRNWWQAEDRERFDELTKRLIAQFDAMESRDVPGQYLNGGLTVGENIGDLGGLAMGFSAYSLATQEEGAPEIDGWTGPQRFFLSWAQIWGQLTRPAEAARLLAIDPHAPTYARGNAVRNLDEFHEAFGTAEGDGMWLAPAERVRVFGAR